MHQALKDFVANLRPAGGTMVARRDVVERLISVSLAIGTGAELYGLARDVASLGGVLVERGYPAAAVSELLLNLRPVFDRLGRLAEGEGKAMRARAAAVQREASRQRRETTASARRLEGGFRPTASGIGLRGGRSRR